MGVSGFVSSPCSLFSPVPPSALGHNGKMGEFVLPLFEPPSTARGRRSVSSLVCAPPSSSVHQKNVPSQSCLLSRAESPNTSKPSAFRQLAKIRASVRPSGPRRSRIVLLSCGPSTLLAVVFVFTSRIKSLSRQRVPLLSEVLAFRRVVFFFLPSGRPRSSL